ncbi:MAG: hypothetical protein A2277_14445 [Desulfobacterales bacterium RIFOXYA12_FULL_46_15]|nr:MAG: hypothetical protein A2097_01925 [Desulfobacula sp. GWF2_41_7]OGR28159.1 MAG: hypothetical protein A2277_14445 [Desulfobacterales bacterium RIFOXYA12_FULL_46_15]
MKTIDYQKTNMGKSQDIRIKPSEIIIWVFILAVLYFLSRYNYLLFHGLAELFSIAISWAIFMIAQNSRQYLGNHYFRFISIAYLFVSVLDLLHMLAYKGMGVFPGQDADLPTQLWIMARYMQSLSMVIAPFLVEKKIRPGPISAVYAAIVIFLVASVYQWDLFPDCFIEGHGLTAFKKTSEYMISILLMISAALLFNKRQEFNPYILKILIAATGLTILSELSFTFYISVFGFSNLVGHYFKILAFYLIYKALIQAALKRPYDLIFKKLIQKQDALDEIQRGQRLLIQNIPGMIYRARPDWSAVIISGSEKLCGYSEDELNRKEKKWFDIILEQDRENVFSQGSELVKAPENLVQTYRIKTREGMIKWVADHKTSYFSDQGDFLGIDGIVFDITREMEMQETLRRLSFQDGLTGVANRRKLDQVMDLEFRRCARSGKPLAVLICDIDFFKAYNDTYGHLKGDECLMAVAKKLDSLFNRPGDLFARYGGEEFAVILPETGLDTALLMAEKIRVKIEQRQIEHVGAKNQNIVTISVGGCVVVPDSRLTSEDLFRQADQALYQAKKEGRNTIRVYLYDSKPAAGSK